MLDGVRGAASVLGESSVEYPEGAKSAGRAFSPDAGGERVRGERDGGGLGRRGLGGQCSSEKASARQVGSPRTSVLSFSEEACIELGWPSSRPCALFPCWLTVAGREPGLGIKAALGEKVHQLVAPHNTFLAKGSGSSAFPWLPHPVFPASSIWLLAPPSPSTAKPTPVLWGESKSSHPLAWTKSLFP